VAADAPAVLPETADVYWRPRVDARNLRTRGRLWTLTTVAHVVPFLATGVLLLALEPLSAPVALIAWAHAWFIPMLYAQRGANVLKQRTTGGPAAERVALGLLGDLVGHDARELHARTGLILERGRLGVWLVGPAGALLFTSRRRVHCWCVRVPDAGLPSSDRIAHLLLALRADEQGFATVSNLAFSGAPWRVARRLEACQRPALRVAAVSTSGRDAPAALRTART
jgi:hypothetical protein